jgi:hypothetical protein
MPIPRTPILCAPSNAISPLGTGMPSSDLIKGLRVLNPRIYIPMPEHYREWYPGQRAGQTCIWLGHPAAEGSDKICAFHLGMIPEWTQVGPDKVMIARGWRSILDLCIRRRVAAKRAVERVFNVRMDIDGKDGLCRICRKDGLKSPVDGKADVCVAHRHAAMNLNQHRENKKEAAWKQEHPPGPKRGPYIFHHRRPQHASQAQPQ